MSDEWTVCGLLAFLIDTQHDCAFGWRQVEPDDIAYFLYEQRIGGELESLDAVGLQTEGAPDAMHRRRRMTDLFSHAPEAPVCATPLVASPTFCGSCSRFRRRQSRVVRRAVARRRDRPFLARQSGSAKCR